MNIFESNSNEKKSIAPLMPNINFSTAYEFFFPEQLTDYHSDKFNKYRYTRDSNEIATLLETLIQSKHVGFRALVFNSGMAAITTLLDSIWTNSDTVILQDEVYRKTSSVFERRKNTSNMKIYSLSSKTSEVIFQKQEIDPTSQNIIVFLEIPSNPHLRIIDIEKVRKKFGKSAVIVLDASLTSLGSLTLHAMELVDAIIYSATKYISGHNDVFGGFVLVKSNLFENLWESRSRLGSILNPRDAYEIYRSLLTLDLRINKQIENSRMILNFLESFYKKNIAAIYFPGEFDNANQSELAKKTLNFLGSMISFVPNKSISEIESSFPILKHFKLSPSFGSVDTLFEIPKTMSHATLSSTDFKKLGIEDNLIRLSIGIEPIDDLLSDLEKLLI